MLRSAVALLGLVALLAWWPATAQASETGSCWATGYASPTSGSAPGIVDDGNHGRGGVSAVDLTSAQVWRVRPGDALVVTGGTPYPVGAVSGSLVLFGVPVPIVIGNGTRSGTANSGPWPMSIWSVLAREFGISAQGGPCRGSAVVEVDRSPFLTLAGTGGLLMLLMGLALGVYLALQAVAGEPLPRVITWVLAAASGLLAGIGLGLWLQQTGALSPLDPRDLVLPLAGLLAGMALGSVPELRHLLSPRAGDVARVAPVVAPGAAAVALIAAVAAGIVVPPLRPPLTDQVLTGPQARAVMLQMWDALSKAHAAQSTDGLGSRFSGEGHDWATTMATATDEPDKSAITNQLRVDSVSVPHRRGYPMSFLATGTVATNDPGEWHLMKVFALFTRQGPDKPWVVPAVDDEPAPITLPQLAADGEGYAVAQRSHLVVSPQQAVNAYVAYLSSGIAAGAPPRSSVFADGPYTSDRVNGESQANAQSRQGEVAVTATFGSPRLMWTGAQADGGTLEMLSYEETTIAQAIGGGCVQTTIGDQPTSFQVFKVVYRYVAFISIPGRGAQSRLLDVVGSSNYAYDWSGLPCAG